MKTVKWIYCFILNIMTIFHLKMWLAPAGLNWCIFLLKCNYSCSFFCVRVYKKRIIKAGHTSVWKLQLGQNARIKHPATKDKEGVDKILVFFLRLRPRSHGTAGCALMYSGGLPHYVAQHWAPVHHIPLPRCLSRFPSVCFCLSKVIPAAEGSLQPWAANWPGNVCSPVPLPTYSPVNQAGTRVGLSLTVVAFCH